MAKPAPKPSLETQPYWDGAAMGELRYTRCAGCAKALFPPRGQCPSCGGATTWCVSAGTGRIHTMTEVFRAPTEAFRSEVPYIVALIDLEEGFRIMANVRGGDAAIGARVSIMFEDIGNGFSLPQALLASVAHKG